MNENQSLKRIDIRVVYGNDDAQRFYEKLGFKPLSVLLSMKQNGQIGENILEIRKIDSKKKLYGFTFVGR